MPQQFPPIISISEMGKGRKSRVADLLSMVNLSQNELLDVPTSLYTEKSIQVAPDQTIVCTYYTYMYLSICKPTHSRVADRFVIVHSPNTGLTFTFDLYFL